MKHLQHPQKHCHFMLQVEVQLFILLSCGIGNCIGIVSRPEKNYTLKIDLPLDDPTRLNMTDIAKTLPKHSNKL